MQKTGQITRWDAERAFVFIRSPDSAADVFFHLRDFQGTAAPRMGMKVVFEEIHVGGKGLRAMSMRPGAQAAAGPGHTPSPPPMQPRGNRRAAARPGAQKGRHARPGAQPPTLEWLAFGAMGLLWAALMAGGIRAQQLPLWTLGAALALNVFTFIAYALDKNAARQGMWRTKESYLHLLALASGWPAAWLAQQTLRHKSQKPAFRAVYAATVVVHCAALTAWVTGGGYPSLFPGG